MLVLVRTLRTKITLEGEGCDIVLRSLQEIYPDLEVCSEDDDELVDVQETAWYKSIAQTLTAGKKLYNRRKMAGLTLDQLAEKSGIAKSNLSAMENDKRDIGKAVAQKLAEALDCDFRSLL